VTLPACERELALERYDVVGREGVVRLVVVSPGTAEDDAALLRIADALRREIPGETIQMLVWDDPALAATSVPVTGPALEAQRAQVNINPATNQREVRRP
jgi:hypothetical protein